MNLTWHGIVDTNKQLIAFQKKSFRWRKRNWWLLQENAEYISSVYWVPMVGNDFRTHHHKGIYCPFFFVFMLSSVINLGFYSIGFIHQPSVRKNHQTWRASKDVFQSAPDELKRFTGGRDALQARRPLENEDPCDLASHKYTEPYSHWARRQYNWTFWPRSEQDCGAIPTHTHTHACAHLIPSAIERDARQMSWQKGSNLTRKRWGHSLGLVTREKDSWNIVRGEKVQNGEEEEETARENKTNKQNGV